MTYMKTEAKAEAEQLWPKGWPNRNMMIAAFVAGAVWAAPRPAYPAEHDRQVAERAWDKGARWAAVECGAIDDERQAWVAPGDNPYTKGEQK